MLHGGAGETYGEALLDGCLEVLYRREMGGGLQNDHPGELRGICCPCVQGEPGEGLLELGGFAGYPRTCFVQEKCKSSFPKKRLVLAKYITIDSQRASSQTGCKICLMSQIAFQHLTRSSAKCSLLHADKHLFLPSILL